MKGRQMVLAQRINLNVFDQDDLTRTRLGKRPVDDLIEILPIALCEKLSAPPPDLGFVGDPLDEHLPQCFAVVRGYAFAFCRVSL